MTGKSSEAWPLRGRGQIPQTCLRDAMSSSESGDFLKITALLNIKQQPKSRAGSRASMIFLRQPTI